MKQTFYLLFALAVCFATNFKAEAGNQAYIDSLINKLDSARTDTAKVFLYEGILYHYVYFAPQYGLKYVTPALQLTEKMKWPMGTVRIMNQAGRLYWRMGKFDQALKEHFGMLRIARAEKNDEWIALSHIAIGQDYADAGNYPEASSNFKITLDIYTTSGLKDGLPYVLNLLAWVSNSQGNYAEATKYNYATLKLFEENGDQDGIAVTLGNIADAQFHLGNYDTAISLYRKSLVLKIRLKDEINSALSYNSLGKTYAAKGKYNDAIVNYTTGLKIATAIGDLSSMAQSNYGIGSVYIIQGKYTDALNYYSKAEVNYESINNKQDLASLFSEMGVLYSKLRMFKEAKIYFDDALNLSNELNSNASFSSYYKGKELYDSLTGSWESAYKNYKRYINIRDSTFNKESIGKMLSAQMQYESEKKEAAAKAEQEKKDIRQRTIRNSIIAALGGTVIFLVVVYRQRNKISKARKRSDELLLNILPEEVAEELKEKGQADAKHFDYVTVMFTDFKDFTKISEKLSPAELVAEIDTCFKAFDEIIQRHNVEKIKTIGDAYMCAGGLPVANKTHAIDVVNAAIEILDFMNSHLSERKKSGKDPFEIRIGVHTGPVVAGIVGVKKFAYDIWGDTVNIASRMESSGVAGKINISGATYESIKELPAGMAGSIKFTHRGKIQAKNKGEIDMYFAEKNSLY